MQNLTESVIRARDHLKKNPLDVLCFDVTEEELEDTKEKMAEHDLVCFGFCKETSTMFVGTK